MNEQQRREALHQLADEAYALGWNRGDRDSLNQDIEGLLALLAPEPEPSDAEIEAGAKELWDKCYSDGQESWESETENGKKYVRRVVSIVLAAARAARQTGGRG